MLDITVIPCTVTISLSSHLFYQLSAFLFLSCFSHRCGVVAKFTLLVFPSQCHSCGNMIEGLVCQLFQQEAWHQMLVVFNHRNINTWRKHWGDCLETGLSMYEHFLVQQCSFQWKLELKTNTKLTSEFKFQFGFGFSGFSMWHVLEIVVGGFLWVLRFSPILYCLRISIKWYSNDKGNFSSAQINSWAVFMHLVAKLYMLDSHISLWPCEFVWETICGAVSRSINCACWCRYQ